MGKQMGFILEEKDHKRYVQIKYTFIRQGELMISNAEVMRRLLDHYFETHDIMEIPDVVYNNYLKKGQTAGERRTETKRLNRRGRPKKE